MVIEQQSTKKQAPYTEFEYRDGVFTAAPNAGWWDLCDPDTSFENGGCDIPHLHVKEITE